MRPFEKAIPVSTFRELLHEIIEQHPDTCMRFRLIGKMWEPNFFRVLEIDERGATFRDVATDGRIFVPDLNHIMQFEIDLGTNEFQPHFHYNVQPEAQKPKQKPSC